MNGDEPVHGVEVGIFAGDECRGAAVEEEGNYWFISVAGDEPTPLTIKVYDPAEQKTTLVGQSLQYTDDATLGTLAEPYIIQLNSAEGVEEIVNGQSSNRKVMEDGILYILRNGEKYDATGKKLTK